MNLVGKLLKRLYQSDAKNQIHKITGRIFIKFGESKLYALNEIGIYNLVTLFLVLASTTAVHEVVRNHLKLIVLIL